MLPAPSWDAQGGISLRATGPGPYLGIQGEEAGAAGVLLRCLQDGVAILVVTSAEEAVVKDASKIPVLVRKWARDLELLVDDLAQVHGDSHCPAL